MPIFEIITNKRSEPYYVNCEEISEAMDYVLSKLKSRIDSVPLGAFMSPALISPFTGKLTPSHEESKKEALEAVEKEKRSIKIISAKQFFGEFIDLEGKS
jgi:hypothetical protein